MTDDDSTQPGDASPGYIDIHSHLLPAIDDGCASIEESFASIRRLKEMGFVASVCTPHIWPEAYPDNHPLPIRQWTAKLADRLADEGLNYPIYPGGELRLFKGVIDYMKNQGVPVLGQSSNVLIDLWVDRWPRWATRAIDWLLEEGYTPILAHPERLGQIKKLDDLLESLTTQGVLLQGNLRCLIGEEGVLPQQRIRQWLVEQRYTFLALDMHRTDTLESRLKGISAAESWVGGPVLRKLMAQRVREMILPDAPMVANSDSDS